MAEQEKRSYFAKKLKELRLSRRMTQQQLADQMELSRACIANYESSKREPSYTLVLKLSDFFHVTADALLNPNAGAHTVHESIYLDKEFSDHYVDISRLSETDKLRVKNYALQLEYEAKQRAQQYPE